MAEPQVAAKTPTGDAHGSRRQSDSGWQPTRGRGMSTWWRVNWKARMSRSCSRRMCASSRWSDRVKRVTAPLFPSYVFVHVSDDERVRVLQTAGVVNIVSVAGKPAPLREEEVAMLRECAARPSEVRATCVSECRPAGAGKARAIRGMGRYPDPQEERGAPGGQRGADHAVGVGGPRWRRCRGNGVSNLRELSRYFA